MSKTSISDFLEELSALTIKYQLEIGGCGCCGSPFIYHSDDYIKDEDGFYIQDQNGKLKITPHVYDETEEYILKDPGRDSELTWAKKDES